ncbi:MAG: response regulator [Methanobacteriaceae archaeon]|nr:response regulator [Methanobacteriaceae archaeon]
MSKDLKTILLVEDDPDDVNLTLRALNKSNINQEIVVANDGLEAIEYLFGEGKYADRDSSKIPELILLDLKLPKMDGIEVLKKLRSNDKTRTATVIILTSSKETEDIVECYKLCANSYIQKPVDFNLFLETVWILGRYWLNCNENVSSGG